MSAPKIADAEATKAVASCLAVTLFLPISFALRAWILVCYWRWFALPLGAAAVPWWALSAVALVLGYLTYVPRKSEGNATELIAHGLFLHASALLLGWLLSFAVGGAV